MNEPWTYCKTLINLLSAREYGAAANLGSSRLFSRALLQYLFNNEEFETLSNEYINSNSVISGPEEKRILACPPIGLSDRFIKLEFNIARDNDQIPQSRLRGVYCYSTTGEDVRELGAPGGGGDIGAGATASLYELGLPNEVVDKLHIIAVSYISKDVEALQALTLPEASVDGLLGQMAGYLAPMFAPSVGLIRELRYVVRTDGVIVVDVPLLGEPENVNHRSGERVDEISVGYLIVHIAEQRDVYLYDVLPSY